MGANDGYRLEDWAALFVMGVLMFSGIALAIAAST